MPRFDDQGIINLISKDIGSLVIEDVIKLGAGPQPTLIDYLSI